MAEKTGPAACTAPEARHKGKGICTAALMVPAKIDMPAGVCTRDAARWPLTPRSWGRNTPHPRDIDARKPNTLGISDLVFTLLLAIPTPKPAADTDYLASDWIENHWDGRSALTAHVQWPACRV